MDTQLSSSVLQSIREFKTMYVEDFYYSISSSSNRFSLHDTVRFGRLSSSKNGLALIQDINSWTDYQIKGHLANIFGIQLNVEQLRDSSYMKEELVNNNSKIVEDATSRAEMWAALLNTDAPFQALYSLGELMAKMDGYNDLSLGGTYIKTFVSVLSQKKTQVPLLPPVKDAGTY